MVSSYRMHLELELSIILLHVFFLCFWNQSFKHPQVSISSILFSHSFCSCSTIESFAPRWYGDQKLVWRNIFFCKDATAMRFCKIQFRQKIPLAVLGCVKQYLNMDTQWHEGHSRTIIQMKSLRQVHTKFLQRSTARECSNNGRKTLRMRVMAPAMASQNTPSAQNTSKVWLNIL